MKHYIFLLTVIALTFSCNGRKSGVYNDGYVAYAPTSLTPEEKEMVVKAIAPLHERYEPEFKMLATDIRAWNYHTDALSGHFHEVRGSFSYAVALLDLGDPQYRQRAFDIIEKTVSLQDVDPNSKSCGVWPYYEEEQLATKKSPIDYNWADFNAVSLLDIYMGHRDELPPALLEKVENALILAGKSVQKRNCGPGYTNIAIMGTYVTWMVSRLFDLPEMQEYAAKRLKTFYEYTLEKNGFSEYNSPTYTIVALDELERMRRHIVEPEAKAMIEELYAVAWGIIARHYHRPSGQWAGPHSRSYSTLIRPSFYGLLFEASGGKIDMGVRPSRSDAKIKHQIPASILPLFLKPVYPRVERDVFENREPQIVGTTYLTQSYALSSANRSSLWNQRRPFLVYWGTQQPHYLQVRLLHDFYDLSTAMYFSEQRDSTVLSVVNFATDGGDKHINIDIIKEGKFTAKDLRLRFEFGAVSADELPPLPQHDYAPICFILDGLPFSLQLFYSVFGSYKGCWKKGGDETCAWLDYVIYSGDETEIDLAHTDAAALGFAFGVGNMSEEAAACTVKNGLLSAAWKGLKVNAPVKPDKKPANY
ncbi:MAG: hypothetical protein LBC19_12175 [Tannerella sp.]|nr:hypothetical protein [Tannerella sp.]